MQIGHVRSLFILVCMSATFGCQVNKNQSVPVGLIGIWNTDEPRYADRPFEITRDAVIVERGEGCYEFTVYPIVEVKANTSQEGTDYIITYTAQRGLKYEFSFSYYPKEGGVIEFKNQKGFLWRRTSIVNNAY